MTEEEERRVTGFKSESVLCFIKIGIYVHSNDVPQLNPWYFGLDRWGNLSLRRKEIIVLFLTVNNYSLFLRVTYFFV